MYNGEAFQVREKRAPAHMNKLLVPVLVFLKNAWSKWHFVFASFRADCPFVFRFLHLETFARRFQLPCKTGVKTVDSG